MKRGADVPPRAAGEDGGDAGLNPDALAAGDGRQTRGHSAHRRGREGKVPAEARPQ